MAKPIEGIPPFKGKAGTWLVKQLKDSKPDPKKAELATRDREMVKRHIKTKTVCRYPAPPTG